MADWTVKAHDTWPPLKAKLEQLNESTGFFEAINLTGVVKIKFIAKSKVHEIKGNCTGPNGAAFDTTGKVEYTWATGDTANAEEFSVEFEIEWKVTPLEIETVPNGGYKALLIVPDLEGA